MITKIIPHKRPHADELVARMILRKFPEGENKFPGVKSATTEFMSTGELPEGKTFLDFPESIFLGCGGGPFDEHATSKKDRVEDECCATLVSKYLGLESNKGLEKILYFIKAEDLGGSKVKKELPMVIKFLHSCYPNEFEKISEWTEDAYYAIYLDEVERWNGIKNEIDASFLWEKEKKKWQRPTLDNVLLLLKKQNYKKIDWWVKFSEEAFEYQKKRFEEAGKEFSERGSIQRLKTHSSKDLIIAIVESDNEEMGKYTRSKGADVVIQFQNGGRTFVTTRSQAHIDLSYSFVLLRMAEQHYRGGIKIKDEKELSKEGFVDGVPCWYLFHTKQMGFNGSLTTTDVEVSKIPKDKIVELIKEGIKRN